MSDLCACGRRLEQVGWLNPALTEPEDCPIGMAREPKEFYEGYTVPVYRLVNAVEATA